MALLGEANTYYFSWKAGVFAYCCFTGKLVSWTAVHKERHIYNISGVFEGNISVVHADLSTVFILLKAHMKLFWIPRDNATVNERECIHEENTISNCEYLALLSSPPACFCTLWKEADDSQHPFIQTHSGSTHPLTLMYFSVMEREGE